MIEMYRRVRPASDEDVQRGANYPHYYELAWLDERATTVDQFGDSRVSGYWLECWRFAPKEERFDEFVWIRRNFWHAAADPRRPGWLDGWQAGGVKLEIEVEVTPDGNIQIQPDAAGRLDLDEITMLEAMVARGLELIHAGVTP